MTVQQQELQQQDNNDSILSDLTLSFFDHNTSELNHLSDSLGIHLSLNNLNSTTGKSKFTGQQRRNSIIKEEKGDDNNDEGQFQHYRPQYQQYQPQLQAADSDDNEDIQSKRDRISAQYRIHRASEILQSSLRASSLIHSNDCPDIEEPKENTTTYTTARASAVESTDVSKLQQELSDSQSRVKELETSYRSLQVASQQALHEFAQLKEDFDRESVIKSQQELTIISLLKENGGLLSKKEIDKVAILRVELERACKEMAEYRDRIVNNIGQTVTHSSIIKDYQKALKLQIKSLIQERDFLQTQTKDLMLSREEIIHEMVLLNTKNAELTTMNNDLSRLAFEKEEANNNHSSSPPLSPSQASAATLTLAESHIAQPRLRKNSNASSIMSKMSARRSFIATQSPNSLFRLKKKGSTVFGKFSASNHSLPGPTVNANKGGNRYLKPEMSSPSLTVEHEERATAGFYNSMYNYSTLSLSIPATVSPLYSENGSGTLGRSVTPNTLNSSTIHSRYNVKDSSAPSPLQKVSSSSNAGHGSTQANNSNNLDTNAYHHSFHLNSFLRPTKCGVCGDKIWGRSEYRCQQCGYPSHTRCLSKVSEYCQQSAPSPLSPSAAISNNSDLFTAITTSDFTASAFHDNSSSILSPETASMSSQLTANNDAKSLPTPKKSFSEVSMFGFELGDRVQFEGRNVPLIVEECIKEVEARGLDYEGIYRKSGGAAQIRAIQLAFDQGEKVDLGNEEQYNDICAITSVLKQYFRELPNPLLTYELYDNFIEISTMDHSDNKLKAFIDVLSMLPKAHQDTLILLFNHLVKVHMHSGINRMNIKNLSMVFAPTIMRHKDPSRDFLDISYKNATIEYILLHTSEIFPYIGSLNTSSLSDP